MGIRILVGYPPCDPLSTSWLTPPTSSLEDLLPVQPTDNGWPVFIRVHPILEWNHADVWAFLRSTGLPHCSLYDEGFTSLGGTDDTCRNPSLARTSHDGVVSYAPAWALGEDGDERDSRMKKR
jgi:FAD synthetase